MNLAVTQILKEFQERLDYACWALVLGYYRLASDYKQQASVCVDILRKLGYNMPDVFELQEIGILWPEYHGFHRWEARNN